MVDVSLVKCASYDDRAVMASVKRAVDLIGGIRRFAKKGEKILLKPNILYGKPPEAAVTTHPAVLKSVARLVMSAGAMPSVGESSGGPISTVKSAKKAGIIDACEELGIPFIEFRRNRRRKIPEGALMKAFDIAGELEDFNGVISIPKLKTHTFQTLTGAIKNTFGCVPGMKKIELHVRMQDRELFASMLLDLHLLIDPRLNVMDGIMGMEGMGPGAGDPIKAGLISASSSGVAMDYVIAKAVKIPEKHIFVLKEARKRALLDDISVKGETPESFGVSFRYPQSYKGSLVRTTGIKLLKNMLTQHPAVRRPFCVGCGRCAMSCPVKAIRMFHGTPRFDYSKCIRCYCCQELCPEKAVFLKRPLLMRIMTMK